MTKYFIATFAILLILVSGIWAIQYFTADTRGAISQQEIVRADGRFRVQSYDHFFNLCSSIQTAEKRISILEDELLTADTFRERELRPAITASSIDRERMINQYNVDAAKEGSVGIFRSNKLPIFINTNEKETQCIYLG